MSVETRVVCAESGIPIRTYPIFAGDYQPIEPFEDAIVFAGCRKPDEAGSLLINPVNKVLIAVLEFADLKDREEPQLTVITGITHLIWTGQLAIVSSGCKQEIYFRQWEGAEESPQVEEMRLKALQRDPSAVTSLSNALKNHRLRGEIR